jgi:hypothetical protein
MIATDKDWLGDLDALPAATIAAVAAVSWPPDLAVPSAGVVRSVPLCSHTDIALHASRSSAAGCKEAVATIDDELMNCCFRSTRFTN